MTFLGDAVGMPGFHPQQLDNGSTKILRGWFDPRDGRTLTRVSGRVTAITNKVSGVPAVEVAGNGPLWAPTGINGGPALEGTGVNWLQTTEAPLVAVAGAAGGDAACTIIWLMFRPVGFGACWGWGDPTEPFNNQYFSGGTGITRNDGSGQTQWSDAPLLSTPIAMSQVWYGGSTLPTLRQNCVDMPQSVTAGAPPRGCGVPTHFTLMARSRATRDPMVGFGGPYLIYTGALSAPEQDVGANGLLGWYRLPKGP